MFTIPMIPSAPSTLSPHTWILSPNLSPRDTLVCILRLRTEGPRRRYTKRVECLSSFSSSSSLVLLPDRLHRRPQIDHIPLLSRQYFFLAEGLFSIHTVSRHRLVLNSYKPFLVHRSPPPPSLPHFTFSFSLSLPLSLPFSASTLFLSLSRLTSLSFTSPGLPPVDCERDIS